MNRHTDSIITLEYQLTWVPYASKLPYATAMLNPFRPKIFVIIKLKFYKIGGTRRVELHKLTC